MPANNSATGEMKLLLTVYFSILLILYAVRGWSFGVSPLLAVTFILGSGALLFMLGNFSFWQKVVKAWFIYALFG